MVLFLIVSQRGGKHEKKMYGYDGFGDAYRHTVGLYVIGM